MGMQIDRAAHPAVPSAPAQATSTLLPHTAQRLRRTTHSTAPKPSAHTILPTLHTPHSASPTHPILPSPTPTAPTSSHRFTLPILRPQPPPPCPCAPHFCSSGSMMTLHTSGKERSQPWHQVAYQSVGSGRQYEACRGGRAVGKAQGEWGSRAMGTGALTAKHGSRWRTSLWAVGREVGGGGRAAKGSVGDGLKGQGGRDKPCKTTKPVCQPL